MEEEFKQPVRRSFLRWRKNLSNYINCAPLLPQVEEEFKQFSEDLLRMNREPAALTWKTFDLSEEEDVDGRAERYVSREETLGIEQELWRREGVYFERFEAQGGMDHG